MDCTYMRFRFIMSCVDWIEDTMGENSESENKR